MVEVIYSVGDNNSSALEERVEAFRQIADSKRYRYLKKLSYIWRKEKEREELFREIENDFAKFYVKRKMYKTKRNHLLATEKILLAKIKNKINVEENKKRLDNLTP